MNKRVAAICLSLASVAIGIVSSNLHFTVSTKYQSDVLQIFLICLYTMPAFVALWLGRCLTKSIQPGHGWIRKLMVVHGALAIQLLLTGAVFEITKATLGKDIIHWYETRDESVQKVDAEKGKIDYAAIEKVTFAPIAEEVAFRLAIDLLPIGPILKLASSSVLFGAAHLTRFDLAGIPLVIFLGALLWWIYRLYGIYWSIVAHIWFNFGALNLPILFPDYANVLLILSKLNVVLMPVTLCVFAVSSFRVFFKKELR